MTATVGVGSGEDVVAGVDDDLGGRRARGIGGTGLGENRVADPHQRIRLPGATGIGGRVEVDPVRVAQPLLEPVEGDLDDRTLVGGESSGDPEHVLLVVPGVEMALGR